MILARDRASRPSAAIWAAGVSASTLPGSEAQQLWAAFTAVSRELAETSRMTRTPAFLASFVAIAPREPRELVLWAAMPRSWAPRVFDQGSASRPEPTPPTGPRRRWC